MSAGGAASAGAERVEVPFTRLDNADPELLEELLGVVAEVAGRAAFSLGPPVESFEGAFAAWCEAEHAIGVSSGTAALELALRGLGIGPGDEVIVPTNSFIASAEAVSAAGAVPRLVDVDPETALLTAEIVAAAITPRTRAVIPVHLYGRTVEMDPLLELCREHGLAVVEDACQAHGARYRGRPVGSLGDAGCFSFYPTKNLGAWGDGGAVTCNDPELARQVRLWRSHGEGNRHEHQMPARTDRLDALQAAILERKLTYLDEVNRNRRRLGAELTAAVTGTSVAPPPAPATDGDHVFHLFVVRTDARDQLREHLAAAGVASAIHYPTPIHLQPAYAGLGLGPGSLPGAERLAETILSLPIFPTMSGAQVEAVGAAVREFSG